MVFLLQGHFAGGWGMLFLFCLVTIHSLTAYGIGGGGIRWMSGCIKRENHMYTHKHTHVYIYSRLIKISPHHGLA